MTTLEEMRAEINRYTPGNTRPEAEHGYQRVALQLFGLMGHGKSSLINSCLCVLADAEYRNEAGAGQSDGTMTTSRTEHKLTNELVMIDNRGFAKLDSDEILEARAQLRSLRDIGKVSWEDNLTKTLEQIPKKYSQRPADVIVPIYVYSATQAWSQSDGTDIQKLTKSALTITGSSSCLQTSAIETRTSIPSAV
ncbi:uncharacterized protein LOC134945860 isoform X2 [Pseudophryne corroboree]|uniref:uncharacterized protein LOC134945860 isoform X2 n=1 Tax=Pseudophryne corroboree TaxID=495146 RepID=UPI003081D612